jgi:hypothetical protein
MKTEAPKDVNRIFVEDGQEAGLPVVVYRGGKAVWVMPQDLGF